MTTIADTKSDKSESNLPLFFFLFVAVSLSVLCSVIDPGFYAKILGELNPVPVFVVSGFVAYYAQKYLRRYGIIFGANATIKTIVMCFFVSVLLGLMPVIIDLAAPFPRDINILYPKSFLFYPTIGVLAEILFHLIPATLLFLIFTSKLQKHPAVLILIIASVEPVFQVIFGAGPDGLSIRDFFLFLEVYVFGLFQVYVFIKYGFLCMYLSRLGFYLTWHFILGTLRLL